MLGWGADYPDQTNFLGLPLRGRRRRSSSATSTRTSSTALDEGAQGHQRRGPRAAYTKANNLIKQHVPMIPIAHGGSAMAFRADVEGAHSSPLRNEQLSVMKAGDRPQLVFMQNGEPGGLYCADETDGETLRACEQIMEGLYALRDRRHRRDPAPRRRSASRMPTSPQWTCTLS